MNGFDLVGALLCFALIHSILTACQKWNNSFFACDIFAWLNQTNGLQSMQNGWIKTVGCAIHPPHIFYRKIRWKSCVISVSFVWFFQSAFARANKKITYKVLIKCKNTKNELKNGFIFVQFTFTFLMKWWYAFGRKCYLFDLVFFSKIKY